MVTIWRFLQGFRLADGHGDRCLWRTDGTNETNGTNVAYDGSYVALACWNGIMNNRK